MRHPILFFLAGFAVVTCGGSTEPGQSPSPIYDICSESSECVIRPASCCGQCGAATRADVIALNANQVAAYTGEVCGDDFGCPACYMAPDPTLLGTCEAGHCKVVDLRTHVATECDQPSDCRIRTTACCECGGPTDVEHIVAISSESSFAGLVCDGQACPECAPIYPDEVAARCSMGHCEADWPGMMR